VSSSLSGKVEADVSSTFSETHEADVSSRVSGEPPPRPRFRLPHNAPKLTGQARDAMVAELRQHLRAVAFNARVDHMAGNDRDDLAVDERVAMFGEPPPAVARGP
jgi:hypothetical protein